MARRPGMLLIGLAAVVALLGVNYGPRLVEYLQQREELERRRQQQLEEQKYLRDYPGPNLEVLGDAEGPLKAVWVIPNHQIRIEGIDSIERVKEYVKQHPEWVNLTLVRMHTPEGDKVMREIGVECAGVYVDGHARFLLWDRLGSHPRQSNLERAPGPTGFTFDAVIDVFEQYLENKGAIPRNRTLRVPPDQEPRLRSEPAPPTEKGKTAGAE